MPPRKSTALFNEPGLRMSRLDGLMTVPIDPADEMYLLSSSASHGDRPSEILHTLVDGRRCIHQIVSESETYH
jgi:hypothetical protein